jgi:hypothetical protein
MGAPQLRSTLLETWQPRAQQLGVPQPTSDQDPEYQQIKAMSILIFPIIDDMLMKITNFEDPCHMWLHLQINMRSMTQPILFPHAQSPIMNPLHCLQVNLKFQNYLDLNP